MIYFKLPLTKILLTGCGETGDSSELFCIPGFLI